MSAMVHVQLMCLPLNELCQTCRLQVQTHKQRQHNPVIVRLLRQDQSCVRLQRKYSRMVKDLLLQRTELFVGDSSLSHVQ